EGCVEPDRLDVFGRGQRGRLVREVQEVEDGTRKGELRALAAELLEDEAVELGALRPFLTDAESHRYALASARSRSDQSASASSRPTETRRSPGGTRSPSQRDLASMRDVTPPRLVMLRGRGVPAPTLLAASASATSKDRSPPNPGYRTVS